MCRKERLGSYVVVLEQSEDVFEFYSTDNDKPTEEVQDFKKTNFNVEHRGYQREDILEMERLIIHLFIQSLIYSFSLSINNYWALTCKALVGEDAEKDR